MSLKSRTHFEQVPLEVIKKIVEEKSLEEKIKTGELPRGAKKKRRSARYLRTTPVHVSRVGT